MLKLQAELVERYTRSVVGYCSDYGAEWHFAQASWFVLCVAFLAAAVSAITALVLPAQVPPLDLDQLRQAGVSHSHGLLKLQAQSASLLCHLGPDGDCEEGALGLDGVSGRQPPRPLPLDNPNPTQIAITQSMKIPGIKHMFDNISSFFLSRLDYYPIFAEAWKQHTFILRGEPAHSL